MTDSQAMALIRCAGLIGRHGDILAPFEADLVRTCVERYRDRGPRTVLTASEWRVLEEAIGAMDAVADDARRALSAGAA
ncbi:hypothetical protein GVN24_24635 [Rhizobium sp. CRIBSB]|nr:hypothetical protein [Rhizobium sp. CRIBSB]